MKKFSLNSEWLPVRESVESAHILNLSFESSGVYIVKLKAIDVAGNQSSIKQFVITVL